MSNYFDGIKSPEDFVEIGQPTFVELISASICNTSPAIRRDVPLPSESLRRIAFGKPCQVEHQSTQEEVRSVPLSLSAQNSGYEYQNQLSNITVAKSSFEFRELVKNITKYSNADCSGITLNLGSENCPDSSCKIDVMFSVDNSGSMVAVIDNVKNSVSEMASLIAKVSNGNYRLSLQTFGQTTDNGGVQTLLPLRQQPCGNIEQFKTAAATMKADGSFEPWHEAMQSIACGYCKPFWGDPWKFREDSNIRILFIITDESADVITDEAIKWAKAIGDCNIKIFLIWIGSSPYTFVAFRRKGLYDTEAAFFDELANINGGTWIHGPTDGKIMPLVTSYILGLCANEQPPRCGGTNYITNGEFETSVALWSDDSTIAGRSVQWDSVGKRMLLTGATSQSIIDLEPGDLAVLSFDAELTALTQTLKYSVLDGSDNILSEDTISNNVGKIRPSISAEIKFDGVIKVVFSAELGSDEPLYIDNVLLCVLSQSNCGPGSNNSVKNPNFENGVEFWLDDLDQQITPSTDPDVWDDDLKSIIVSLQGEIEVRTIISSLKPGNRYSFNFEVIEFEPEVIGELVLFYGVLDNNNVKIANSSIYRKDITTPGRLQIEFVAPPDGFVKLYFRGGSNSGSMDVGLAGIVKIRNVLVCNTLGLCESGYSKISFDEFVDNKGSWSGGTHDKSGEVLLINFEETVSQTFSGLEPSSKLQITFDALNYNNRVGLFQVEMQSGSIVRQFRTNGLPGIKTFETTVQDAGFVDVRIKNLVNSQAAIDSLLICQKGPITTCNGSVDSMRVLLEWDGIPRNPVNIFRCVLRYTMRDINNPFNLSQYTCLPLTEGHISAQGCDLWKSQAGSGVVLRKLPFDVNKAQQGLLSQVQNESDWLWSIPQKTENSIQDIFIASFPNPGPNRLIESVEVLLLANSISPTTEVPETYPPPLSCPIDPATNINIAISYVNSKGLNREFTIQVPASELYSETANFDPINKWDSDTSTGNGIRGIAARWESILFELDTLDGQGLDQCTDPIIFNTSGSGNLSLVNPILSSSGYFVDPCDSEVIVEDISSNGSLNEIQSIEMPAAVDGTWDLSFTKNDVTRTTTLPWNANANDIKNALALLPNIDGAKNIKVTGNGTKSTPFLVEFIGDLAGVDHEILVADGSKLVPPGGYNKIDTLEEGTKNERQTIINRSSGWPNDTSSYTNFWRIATGPPGAPAVVRLTVYTTNPMPFGASLNRVQAELGRLVWQGIPGAGNVSVTGNIIDRDARYEGPYIVDFINNLRETNIDQMYAIPQWISGSQSGYTVITNIDGQIGINERQKFLITGGISTFNLRIHNEINTQFIDINSVPFDIDDIALENLISSAPGSFLTTPRDLRVKTIRTNPAIGLVERTFEFGYGAGSPYRGVNMPSIEASYSSLGLNITVKEVQKGSGSNDRQRITVLRASGGSFKLSITVNGKDHTTTAIPWNTTAEGIQAQLLALRPFQPGDLTVKEIPKTSDEQNIRVIVTFKKSFGNLPLMVPDFQQTLLCDPIILPIIPPPPPLTIPDCEENLGCSSGPLLCKPSFEDNVEVEPCCDNTTISPSANFSSRIKIERELFNPRNGSTVKELTTLKGLKTSNYTPYIRDWDTGRLIETTYETITTTKMSIILIEKPLDTSNGRARVMRQVSKNEILPSRFIWSNRLNSTEG